MLINTKEELEKFKIKSRGFVQVGAHLGSEVKIFKDINPHLQFICLSLK